MRGTHDYGLEKVQNQHVCLFRQYPLGYGTSLHLRHNPP